MEAKNSSPEGQLELLDYWRLLKSRRVLILAVFTAAVCITIVATALQPRVYGSLARIKVESEKATVGVFDLNNSSDQNFLQNQFEIIQSQKILYPVIEKLNLRKEWAGPGQAVELAQSIKDRLFTPLLRAISLVPPADPNGVLPMDEAFYRLKHHMQVRRSGGSSLIEIAVFDNQPQRAALIANTIAQVFEQERLEGKRERVTKGLEKLREQVAEQSQQLQKAQEKVEKLRKELNVPVFSGTRPSDMVVQQLGQELAQARTQLVSQEIRLKELQSLTPEQKRNAIATLINEPNVMRLLQELTDADLKLEVMKQGYGPDHPNVREAQAARNKLQEQLDSRLDGVMRSFEVDYKMSQARVAELEKNVAEAKRALNAMDDVAYLPFRNAEREEESERHLYEAVKSRLQQEAVELEVARSPVEQIDSAKPDYDPVKPNVLRNLLVGVGLGLLLGVALVIAIEFMNTSLKKIEDVEKYLDLPVLGVVPKEVGLISHGNGSVRHIEVYRMLRASIEFAKGGGPIHSLCVLSGGAGEGKSLTTANLACVAAQHGMSVLVVDCDLHRPSIHNYLGTNNETGLADFLDASKTIEQITHPSEVRGLFVIPSGTGSQRNGHLPMITAQRIRELVQEVDKKYDVVLFDTPPILAVSDAAVVAREVGSSIIVVQHRRYPRSMEQRALKVLKSAGAHLLGVVVNNVRVGHADLDYYYQSDYTNYSGAPEHRAEPSAVGEKTGTNS